MPERFLRTAALRLVQLVWAFCLLSAACAIAQESKTVLDSDGDLQMLQWTAAGGGARFMGLVHHTDAGREWAYDRQSSIGRLDKALDEANAKAWTVVDMKADWKVIFPFDKK